MNVKYLKTVIYACLIFFTGIQLQAQEFRVLSPDGRLELNLKHADGYRWSLKLNGKILIEDVQIGMEMNDGRKAGFGKIKSKKSFEANDVIHAQIPYKNAEIQDQYQALSLKTSDGFVLHFRLYPDGVAYRFEDERFESESVTDETMRLDFPEGTECWFPREESMYSHNERMYLQSAVDQIPEGDFCSLPVLFGTQDGAKILFTETALVDYPNMFLEMGQLQRLESIFPKFVLEAIPDSVSGPDRNQKITREADYIAKVSVARQYPWRVFIIGEDDKVLIESNLAYQLARPSAIEDVSWIKPGKVAWDWYNANNIYGVDFESGLNTETYRYYIDFAAENKIEYVIFDEGWTKSTTEILDFNPKMDVKALIKYAESKGVGIILWVLWKPLSENLSEILSTYKSWGAKGIKVDFMQRSDQAMVTSYEAIASEAARLHLLVDFHGAFKPSGLQRTYPNVLNFEGVKGSENNKWSDLITPDHNLTIPFIRMAAGPMDYTPGAMNNAGKRDYDISWERPMSQGTRCHQVAMYVVYEAPLQMMCESPSTYRREQETVDFIREIPTIWDETKVLNARIGDYCIVARRKGLDWYIGGMTDWSSRDFELPLDFLSGNYDATIMADGLNADHFAEDYQIIRQNLNEKDVLKVKLKSGGGFAVILKKK